ncbi:MAG: MBL fold metallo-hydrolase [Bacteroidales bacterium]|nr:MBL fold metallo-hydrolase [Bacteroidales bacterium]
MAQIKCFVFNHIEVNTYLVYDETLSCVVIDPGMETAEENEVFTSFINRNNLKIKAVLLTHTHIDHISGLRCLYDLYKTPVYLHEDAKKILHQAEIYASVMGFETGNLEDIPVTTIDHGGIITFGQSQIEALFVPGHAAGSLCFCLHSDKAVFSGDALFNRSIGRTDLPSGNFQQLLDNLRTKVLSLPDDYTVFPGHGPETTIGYEKEHNPFFNPC